jgi:hypothetical protein
MVRHPQSAAGTPQKDCPGKKSAEPPGKPGKPFTIQIPQDTTSDSRKGCQQDGRYDKNGNIPGGKHSNNQPPGKHQKESSAETEQQRIVLSPLQQYQKHTQQSTDGKDQTQPVGDLLEQCTAKFFAQIFHLSLNKISFPLT